MKLRLRFQKTTTVVCCSFDNDSAKLSKLKNIVAEKFHRKREDFELSLNGKDALTGEDSELSEFGIVNGDLVHVLLSNPDSLANEKVTNSDSTFPCSSESTPVSLKVLQKDMANKPSCSMEVESATSLASEECCNNDGASATNVTSDKVNKRIKMECSETSLTPTDSEVLEATLQLQVTRSEAEMKEINRYLREPMLCREATAISVPNILSEIYTNSSVNKKTEALLTVLHVLMLETGFIPENCVMKGRRRYLPADWRSSAPSVYKILYNHPDCELASCNLVFVPLASQLIVHGNVTNGDFQQPVKTQLPVDDYVNKIKPNNNVAKVYSNLPKLSRLFKDAVTLPLLHRIYSASGSCAFQGFPGLSTEIKLLILKYLDVESLLRMSEVSRSVNSLCKDPWLWRRLYLLYWPKKDDNSLNQDWYEIYKSEYKKRRYWRDRLRKMSPIAPPHGFFPLPPTVPGFAPAGFPPPPGPYSGIIGGEFDLNPLYGFPDPVFPGSGRRIIPERRPYNFSSHLDAMNPTTDLDYHLSAGVPMPHRSYPAPRNTHGRHFGGMRF